MGEIETTVKIEGQLSRISQRYEKVLYKYKKRKNEKVFEGATFMELLEFLLFPISMSFKAFYFCLKSQKN